MEIRDRTGEGGAGGSQLRYQTTVALLNTRLNKTHSGLGPVSAHHTACLWQD